MVLDAYNSEKRFTAANGPVGTGKSLAYMALAQLTGEKTVILTGTRALQRQLMNDFQSMGLTLVMGKNNYKCVAHDDWTCLHGSHSDACTSKGSPACPSTAAYFTALGSRLVVTNYAYWIASHMYGNGLGNVERLVLDEAHSAPSVIAEAMSVTFKERDVKELLKETFPAIPTETSEWRNWARRIKESADTQLQIWEMKVRNDPKVSVINTYQSLLTITRKLATIALIKADDWVVEQQKNGDWKLDPVRVAAFGERVLFRNVPHVHAYSATILPKTLHMCGLKREAFDFFQYESPFNPYDNPVYWIPTAKMTRHCSVDDIRQWVDRHDQIIRARLDRKHIAHTSSFEWQENLTLLSKYKRYMHYNLRGGVTDDLVSRFKRMNPPAILVGPNLGTGYDFPGKECESNIISKVPFPNRGEKITIAREALDPEYSIYHGIQNLVQASGRPRRLMTDKSETFVLDDNMKWLMGRYRYLAPPDFLRSYSRADVIPPPIRV